MADPPSLRVSDQDREEAARQIREHYAAGRLSEQELNERLESVYAGWTEDDLARMLADLPAPAANSGPSG
jgi:phage terminase large subunit-like protein